MAEISHTKLDQHFKESAKDGFAPVYLIYGEDFIYEQAAKAIVAAILPDSSKHRFQHEIHNIQDGGLADAIEHLNTYSIFSSQTVVEFRHPMLFANRFDAGKMVQRIQKAYETLDAAQARRRYLELLGRLRIDPEEITAKTLHEKLGVDPSSFGDPAWLLGINEDCIRNGLSAPELSSDMEIMQRAVEKGFPKNKHLLIVTDTADKRTGLFRAIRKTGVIVDCTIPKGTRKAERDEQRRIFLQHAASITREHGKTMDSAAFDAIINMTGFDLRLFNSDLHKLIDYARDRENITVADVRSVLNSMREDPVYEMTGAVADRNLGKALSVLFSLLAAGTHELQIIMALTNQVRRLLLIRSFLESGPGNAWHPGISYDQFQRSIMPAARQYDEQLATTREALAQSGREKDADETNDETDDEKNKDKSGNTAMRKASAGKSPGQLPDELCVIRKKEHPYAAYSLFSRAANFKTRELTAAFSELNRADVALKTTGQSSRAVLESLIIGVCGIPQK